MARKRETAVSKHLMWLFVQAVFFGPAVFGASTWREAKYSSWGYWAFSIFLAVWLSYCIVRNVVLMWRAPMSEARKSHVAPLFAVGLLLALLGSGPLLEGSAAAKPSGLVLVVVALFALALGVREVVRLRVSRDHVPEPLNALQG
ncbi:hypothetical protein ACOACQ_11610 [Nocardioides sp. CPCC 206347]|uniref:hypothetical protein n=1 Tax=unclassified Nocardioides TaxID=2615069 RepID=UPI00361D3C0D